MTALAIIVTCALLYLVTAVATAVLVAVWMGALDSGTRDLVTAAFVEGWDFPTPLSRRRRNWVWTSTILLCGLLWPLLATYLLRRRRSTK